jgi:hypothetical protein
MVKTPIMAVWLAVLRWKNARPIHSASMAIERALHSLSTITTQTIVAKSVKFRIAVFRYKNRVCANRNRVQAHADRLWRKVSGDKSLRILHGPVNIGNQPWTLSRAERALGCKSEVVQNYGTWIGYPADRTLSELGKDTPEARAARQEFLEWAPIHYDVIHYYFGRSFALWDDLGMAFGQPEGDKRSLIQDVLLAKQFGRRVFMTLQGCDARIAGRSNAINTHTPCAEGRCRFFANCIEKVDSQRLAMIEALLPMMDRVFYLNPELGHFVSNGQFLPYGNVDVMASPVLPPRTSGRPRIVHAPSDGATKGTSAILAALAALKSRFDFELLLVEGKPHAEAMEIYKSADIAIDQILYGWYGGFAVELMAMGKPVMCHIRESDLKFVPAAMREDMALLNIHPESLIDDIASILSERTKWVDWSQKSIDYVRKWHNPELIAGFLIDSYRNDQNKTFADHLNY